MKRLIALAAVVMVLGAGTSGAQDGWVSLFDGKTMNGWQPSENPQSWAIENGAIVTRGPRSHLFYVGDVAGHNFRNFEFAAEVMTTPGSNSGIYIHTKSEGPGFPPTGYELQVINTAPPVPAANPNAYIERKMNGSIYAVRNTWTTTTRDGEWYRYRIRVVGKTIQTYINDVLTCEYTEPENPFRPPDKRLRLLGSGTFALQAHDPNSVVHYRGLRVRVLPDDATSDVPAVTDPELDELITRLSNDNFPLIDVGLEMPTGAAAEALRADLRRYGITPGSAFPDMNVNRPGAPITVVNDRTEAPDPVMLQKIKASGGKIAFSSGGDSRLDEARLKRRLQAIRAARLSWQDLWIPGQN